MEIRKGMSQHTWISRKINNQIQRDTMEKFKEYILENQTPKFVARPFYLEEADTVFFFFENSDCFARRVDELLTVYLNSESESLVGVEIKGIKRLLNQFSVQDVETDFRNIFIAYMGQKNPHAENNRYLKEIVGGWGPHEPHNTRVSLPA